MEWEDATSYSRGERGRVAPRSWQTLISGNRVLIMSRNLYYPGLWVMNCDAVGLKEHRLCKSSEPAERAQSLAVSQVHITALRKADEIQKLALEAELLMEATP